MSNFRKPNSYSIVLSAAMCQSFSFCAAGQYPAPKPATLQSESPAKQQQESIGRQRISIAAQQQAVERQRAVAGPAPNSLIYQPPLAAAQATNAFDCQPVPAMILENVIHNAAKTYDVEPDLIHAVIRQESKGYPCAVSDKGAVGLMQLMPDTAAEMGAAEPFDVIQNVSAGTRLLAELMRRYQGDLNRVLGAYNAGPAAVDRSSGIPKFPETINYVRSVLDQLKLPGDPKLFSVPVR